MGIHYPPPNTRASLQWTFGDRLRKSRKARALSAEGMAAEMGVSRQSVSNWESDRNITPMPAVKLWAQVTGVSVDWLCYGSDPDTDLPRGWDHEEDFSPNADCPCNSPWNPAQIALPLAAA